MITSIDNITAARKPALARRRGKVIVKAAHKRSIQQVVAAIAAGFLPVASYVIAHIEAPQDGKSYLYTLVACALAYSAPTLAKWAEGWAGHPAKAWGFTVLLECVSVLSHIQWLNLAGLAILVTINAITAFNKAAK